MPSQSLFDQRGDVRKSLFIFKVRRSVTTHDSIQLSLCFSHNVWIVKHGEYEPRHCCMCLHRSLRFAYHNHSTRNPTVSIPPKLYENADEYGN